MSELLNDRGMDLVSRAARTHRAWLPRPVGDVTLQALYDLMRLGPTSANCQPARILFLRSEAAKERLRPHLVKGNVDRTMAAPVTAVVGYDRLFHEHMDRLLPGRPEMQRLYAQEAERGEEMTAFRNGTLQGAYLIVAARALGLDCGPMSGFDRAGADAAFFPGGRVRTNFLCNLGYGDPAALRPRVPRLDFDEACGIL